MVSKNKEKFIEFDLVDFNKKIGDKFKELGKRMKDMRPLFEQLSSDFYKDEKKIFKLPSAGKYKDLTSKYKIAKQKKWGHIYPILFASGNLASSLLSRNGPYSVNIIDKQFFEIGTNIPYAGYHHSKLPRKKLPRRPVFFFGEDNKDMAYRWSRLIDVYYEKVMKDVF